jgi:hypothetical protein
MADPSISETTQFVGACGGLREAASKNERPGQTLVDRGKAGIVELRFFARLGVQETAAAAGVFSDTVMRDWRPIHRVIHGGAIVFRRVWT